MQARTASSVYSSAISTLILISEVEITWMLMPFSARVLNMRWATPAWLRMPTPMTETLATFGSGCSAAIAELGVALVQHLACARSRSALATVKVRSVMSPSLRDVLHDHVDIDVGVGQRAEDGGGDARAGRAPGSA